MAGGNDRTPSTDPQPVSLKKIHCGEQERASHNAPICASSCAAVTVIHSRAEPFATVG
jgi:hypothetical protein